MNEIKEYTDKIFEDIKHIDENGDVQPGKLLNVFKEETFNTYENTKEAMDRISKLSF